SAGEIGAEKLRPMELSERDLGGLESALLLDEPRETAERIIFEIIDAFGQSVRNGDLVSASVFVPDVFLGYHAFPEFPVGQFRPIFLDANEDLAIAELAHGSAQVMTVDEPWNPAGANHDAGDMVLEVIADLAISHVGDFLGPVLHFFHP